MQLAPFLRDAMVPQTRIDSPPKLDTAEDRDWTSTLKIWSITIGTALNEHLELLERIGIVTFWQLEDDQNRTRKHRLGRVLNYRKQYSRLLSG